MYNETHNIVLIVRTKHNILCFIYVVTLFIINQILSKITLLRAFNNDKSSINT